MIRTEQIKELKEQLALWSLSFPGSILRSPFPEAAPPEHQRGKLP